MLDHMSGHLGLGEVELVTRSTGENWVTIADSCAWATRSWRKCPQCAAYHGPWTAHRGPWADHRGPLAAHNGLPTAGCGLPTVGRGLTTVGPGLPTVGHGLTTVGRSRTKCPTLQCTRVSEYSVNPISIFFELFLGQLLISSAILKLRSKISS